MEWIFNGIGTEIIVFVISSLLGGIVGYKIGVNKNVNQHQKGGDNASQIQIGKINSDNDGYSKGRR